MSSDIATLTGEIKDYKLQLEALQPGLQADPDNAELQNLATELEELIAILESQLQELNPATAARSLPTPTTTTAAASPPPVKEKWSKENHPAYQAGYRKPNAATAAVAAAEEAEKPASFAVNDSVLAKWKSGDKAMWPAKITSITGSSSKPVYIVRFKADGRTETVFAHEIKPLASESKKRKADGPVVIGGSGSNGSSALATPLTPMSPAFGSNPGMVISAAADIDPALASQAKREPSRVSDGPARPAKVPRKVKANKELEAGKSKWQDFSTKGKTSKAAKKESMFRTPDGVNARVGFTGSGQQMRKDPTRSRHIYQQNGEEEGA